MPKKQKTELEANGIERYREGYLFAIGVVNCNLNDIADHLDDYDSHGAKVLRWAASLVSAYEPDE